MNIGTFHANGVGLRAAGSRHNGLTFGGVYYPAHMKNGKTVNARFEAIMFLNRRDYTDASGVRHDGKSETIRVVIWNSPNAAPGKGMADVMAKCISVGKEISCGLDINTFDKRLFINGQPMADAAGNAITYPAVNFKVIGDVIFGADSESTVQAEVAAFNGQANFASRPALWNVQGNADNAAWKNIVQQRMASVCDPTKGSYGYARIVIPEGAQLLQTNAAPVAQTTTVQTAVPAEPTQAASVVTGQPAAAGNNSFDL